MDQAKYEEKIVAALLEFIPPPDTNRNPGEINLKSWTISKEAIKLLETNPNALLLGGIFNRGILAEYAWEKPYQLKKRLGHLDLKKIARMGVTQLQLEIGPQKHGKSLHRYYNIISKSILEASKLLLKKYNGNAKNIWDNGTEAKETVDRFLEFHGIGQKIANMLLMILIKYYGINFKGKDKVDISVDRHVARVFLRTELVPSNKRKKEYSIYELKEDIIRKARNLYPAFPGALDEPTYFIGKYYCTSEKAYCNDDDDPCPLNNVCLKRKKEYQV